MLQARVQTQSKRPQTTETRIAAAAAPAEKVAAIASA
jgi:hypothetical protein